MSDVLKNLSAPFDPARISWRVGSTTQNKDKGMALAYIDSRDVQDRLDAVCGAGGWQCRYPHAGQKTVCEIGVKVGDEWIWKADGAGDTDVEQEKGALSDAFKRAAVKWGIGRYLYDIDSPWVAIVAKGKSYVIAEHEFGRLQKLLVMGAPKAEPTNPGIAKARQWVAAELDAMRENRSADDMMEYITGRKAHWQYICHTHPSLWVGPDGSGFKGESWKIATIMQCEPAMKRWIAEVETPIAQKEAAE